MIKSKIITNHIRNHTYKAIRYYMCFTGQCIARQKEDKYDIFVVHSKFCR